MNPKHTGGKWVHEDGIIWADFDNGSRGRIAEIPTLKNHFTAGAALEEDLANAALIVSSPDLLAACEAACELLVELGADDEPGDMPSPTLEQLRAAIAKARGE